MSFSHHWYDENHLIIVTFNGVLTGQEVLEAYSAVCLDERYYSQYHQLWDFRRATRLRAQKEDVKAMKMMIDLYCPPETSATRRRVAILAPRYHIYAVANAVLTLTGRHSAQRRVFRTFPAAEAWLNVVMDRSPLSG